MLLRLFNIGLRLTSLATKLALTLYMGKYLGLADMGTYGLVAAVVAISIPLLGFRLDYIVSREIVDMPADKLACKMRDQIVLYGLSYAAMAALMILTLFAMPDKFNPHIFLFTVSLCILESLATITAGNFVSLKRPVLSNTLFFIRAALWVFPVIGLGIWDEQFRNAETVFACWLGGLLLSLTVTAFFLKPLPWGTAFRTPVDWLWIRQGLSSCMIVWIGTICMIAAGYVDRFIVEFYLGREYVGIISFYGSFIIAVSSIVHSGIFAFSFANLISLKNNGAWKEFHSIIQKMLWQSTASTAFICLAIGIAVPFMGDLFSRPEYREHEEVLWLMLAGIWVKTLTEAYHYGLYAYHRDKALWFGSLAQLAVAIVATIITIHMMGFIGAGISSLISSTFISVWRYYSYRNLKHDAENHSSPGGTV